MDKKAKAINEAGYIICSVSFHSNGEDWQDGGERAFNIKQFRALYGRVPEIGETVEDRSTEGKEINYTRTK